MASSAGEIESRELRKLVARHKRWLVTQGNEIGGQAGGNPEWSSQARGIWEAARHETEPLVILNLLRYQAARNERTWSGVAVPLGKAIERCREEAKDSGGDALAMELIRHLLVYTIRAHKFQAWQEQQQRRPERGRR
jgi:hypothetical protein